MSKNITLHSTGEYYFVDSETGYLYTKNNCGVLNIVKSKSNITLKEKIIDTFKKIKPKP